MGELTPPGKLTNGNSIPDVEEIDLRLNAYRLDVLEAAEVVYKYELKVFKEKREREGEITEVDLSKKHRHDVLQQKKRRLLWECYQQMLANNPEFFPGTRHDYCYDCGINFYSLHQLSITGEKTGDFTIQHDQLTDESRDFLGRNVAGVRAQLLAAETLHLRDNGVENHAVAQFFDILSNQEILDHDSFLFFAAKIFQRDSVVRLQRDARIMKDGLQKNVRYVGDDLASSIPIMQIDPKKSAFFPEMLLHEFLDNFVPGRGQLHQRLSQPAGFRDAQKQVRRLMVITTYLPQDHMLELAGLTDTTPAEQQFTPRRGGGGQTTVANYFQQQYQLQLAHPNLKCAYEIVTRRVPGQPQPIVERNYYPLELLRIVGGQRVPLDKQTPQLVEQMIRVCQTLPEQFAAKNMEAKNSALITNNNPYFMSHGVRIDEDLLAGKGRVLWPPAITYTEDGRGDRDELRPREANWRLGNRRFLLPGEAPRVWVAIIFDCGVPAQMCNNFLNDYRIAANRRGIPLRDPTRYDELENADLEKLRERFELYRRNDVTFVLFFTAQKLDPLHHTMKELEVEFGILTQHISYPTVEKAMGRQGAQLVKDNLLLKLNLKLGGVNYGLSTGQALRERIGRDIV